MTAHIDYLRFRRSKPDHATPEDLVDVFWDEESGGFVSQNEDGEQSPLGGAASVDNASVVTAIAEDPAATRAAVNLPEIGFSTPSEIDDLEVWFSAGSLALSNGAAVSSWSDDSGNGHDAAQATAGNRPTFVADAFRGLPAVRFDGTDDYLETNSIYDGTETEITAFIVHAKPTDGLGMSLAIAGSPAATDTSRLWLGANNNQQLYCSNYVGFAGAVGSTRLPRILAMTTNTAKVRRLFVDGYIAMRDTASQVLGLNGVMRLGGSIAGSYDTDADIYEVIIYKRALTDTEINIVHSYLQSKYWPDRNHVLFLGDSFVSGLGATVAANALVNNLGTRMGAASLVTGWGTSGVAVASINSTHFAYLKPFLVADQSTVPVVVIVGGRNDLTSGSSAATILAEIKSLCAKIRSMGYKVVYVTPTPYQAGAMETARQTLIDSILADTTFADAIANAGRDPIMGDIANIADTTYFLDGLHPTNVGHTIITKLIEGAVHSCQGRSAGNSNPAIRSQMVSADFPSTADGATASITVTVTGVSSLTIPAVIVSGALPTNWDLVNSYVSANNTVTIIARNSTGGVSDPVAVPLRVMVLGDY
jgi:lysophospholipase L1-like esterase